MFKNYKNIASLFLIAIAFLCFSCADSEFEERQKIKKLEDEDHKYCIKLGLDFGFDAIETELYWRCRVSLAGKITIQRTFSLSSSAKDEYLNNLEIKFQKSFEDLNNYRNNLIGRKHHKICQKRGYDINSIKQDEVEKYLDCRQDLIKTYQVNPPYKKTHYLERPQDSYNIKYVINKRQDHEIERLEEERKKYPRCVHLEIKTKNYKKCINDYDKNAKCLENAQQMRFKKEMEQRMICQRRLYQRFPESLLKKDEIQEEFDRKKVAADIYNNNDFINIGVDDDMLKTFESAEAIRKREEEKIRKAKEKKEQKKEDFNNEEKLYSKAELTALKKKFIVECDKRIKPITEEFIESKNLICQTLILKWQKPNKPQAK